MFGPEPKLLIAQQSASVHFMENHGEKGILEQFANLSSRLMGRKDESSAGSLPAFKVENPRA